MANNANSMKNEGKHSGHNGDQANQSKKKINYYEGVDRIESIPASLLAIHCCYTQISHNPQMIAH